MSNDASAVDTSGAREVYELLNQLDGHINGRTPVAGRAVPGERAPADADYQHR